MVTTRAPRGTALHKNRALAARLLLVSNRGPLEHYIDDLGRIRQRPAGGGVAVALGEAARAEHTDWLAAASGFADRVVAMSSGSVPLEGGGRLRLLDLPEEQNTPFYSVFCNPLLWFIQHSAPEVMDGRDLQADACSSYEEGYVPVNHRFANAVIEEIDRAGDGLQVMLHDYHLYLAPGFIRAKRPHALLQHYIHIPWPRPEVWLSLPDSIVRDLCRGLLGNDSLVFQTEDDATNFLDTCRAYLGSRVEVRPLQREVYFQGRTTSVWDNPISVDPDELLAHAESSAGRAALRDLAAPEGVKTIVRVDRLDPAKNVLRGFEAYDRMLARRPSLRGKVRFLAYLVPSRQGIPEYDDYSRRVFDLVDGINRRYGTDAWQPVTVFHQNDRPQALAGLGLYDVLLVNSIADGMNLVSKEGPLLNRRDGVLVLSTLAGSYRELGGAALGVPPDDVEATSSALETALDMRREERSLRARRLREAVMAHQLSDWLRHLRKDLDIHAYLRQAV